MSPITRLEERHWSSESSEVWSSSAGAATTTDGGEGGGKGGAGATGESETSDGREKTVLVTVEKTKLVTRTKTVGTSGVGGGGATGVAAGRTSTLTGPEGQITTFVAGSVLSASGTFTTLLPTTPLSPTPTNPNKPAIIGGSIAGGLVLLALLVAAAAAAARRCAPQYRFKFRPGKKGVEEAVVDKVREWKPLNGQHGVTGWG